MCKSRIPEIHLLFVSQILMTANGTSGFQSDALGGANTSIPAGQVQDFVFLVNAGGWQNGTVEICTFTVSATSASHNLTGNAQLKLLVVST